MEDGSEGRCPSVDVESVMWIPPRGRGIDPKVMERAIALGKMTAAAEGAQEEG